MTRYYRATFFKKDDKGRMQRCGCIDVSDTNTTIQLPLIAKAFRQAPQQAKNAGKVTFEKINPLTRNSP